MKRLLCVFLFFALASFGLGNVSASAEEAALSSKPSSNRKIKVFIMSGQSGMAGFGRSHELPDSLRKGNDRVLMFVDGTWQPLRPFNVYPENLRRKFGLTEFSFGPEISFAHAMAEAWPNETIGIVKQTAGGTGVLAWHPNWTKEQADRTKNAGRGNLFKALTDKVNAACASRDCELAGFVWSQGAKDMSFVDVAKEYLPNLKAMVAGVRKAVGAEDIPFIYSSHRPSEVNIPDDLSDVVPTIVEGNRPEAMWVLKAQWDAQQAIPNSKMVILRDLEKHPKDQHTNTAGLLELGRIFAMACLDMSNDKNLRQKIKKPAATALHSHDVTHVPSAVAQESRLSEKQKSQLIKRFPRSDANMDGKLDDVELRALREFFEARRKSVPVTPASNGKPQADADKWKTAGFSQGNTMGGGQAAIPKDGKFRVFVLMGQSNMHGTGRAKELKSPYTQKHDRIRIWANGRWEYFVPSQRFGPGVSFAHQLAAFWPEDTIGIIKVSSGGTGIRGFEKKWSFERANLTFDGRKGSLYKDLMNAVTEASRISKPEFCGFVWKQGAADGTKKVLADDYYDTFKQLISDLRSDLGTADLPVFVPSYMNDEDLIKAVMSNMSEEDLQKVRHSAGKALAKKNELLEAILIYLNESSLSKLRKTAGRRPYIAAVIAAQNRAGRDIPNVATIYPGRLPKGADGTHYSSEGYLTLGKFTASAVEAFYKAEE